MHAADGRASAAFPAYPRRVSCQRTAAAAVAKARSEAVKLVTLRGHAAPQQPSCVASARRRHAVHCGAGARRNPAETERSLRWQLAGAPAAASSSAGTSRCGRVPRAPHHARARSECATPGVALAAQQAWEGDAASGSDQPDAPPRADVTPLSRMEQQALLPISATGPQYAYYWGEFDTALQRLFASLLGCLATANAAPLVAVPAGLYFLWAPVALAARRNAPLRRYPYAGLWHARVLQAEPHAARVPGGIVFDAMGDAFLPRRRTSSVLRILVGDASGARLQMEVPWAQELRDIRPGDEAELIVVSDEPLLQRFRAVREAYLPELGLWLSEYPFLERSAFRSVSDAIAAERERAPRAEWRGGSVP